MCCFRCVRALLVSCLGFELDTDAPEFRIMIKKNERAGKHFTPAEFQMAVVCAGGSAARHRAGSRVGGRRSQKSGAAARFFAAAGKRAGALELLANRWLRGIRSDFPQLASQNWQNRNSREVFHRLHKSNLKRGGRKINGTPRRGADAAGGDFPRPVHDHRQRHGFSGIAKIAGGQEKIKIGVRKFFRRGAGGEEDGDVVGHFQFIQLLEQPADAFVEPRDERGAVFCGLRPRRGGKRRVAGHGKIIRAGGGGARRGKIHKQKKRAIMVGGVRLVDAHEIVHRVDEQFRQILLLFAAGVRIDRFRSSVVQIIPRYQLTPLMAVLVERIKRVKPPQCVGKIILRRRIVQKTGELVKSACPRLTAKAPFTNESGAIAVLLEPLCEIRLASSQLGIFSGQQLRGGRRAIRAAGIMREADAVCREPVQVWRLKIRLAVAAQVAARKAVALDENDAGPGPGRGGCRRDIREKGSQIGADGHGKLQQGGEENQETDEFHFEVGLCERGNVQSNSILGFKPLMAESRWPASRRNIRDEFFRRACG